MGITVVIVHGYSERTKSIPGRSQEFLIQEKQLKNNCYNKITYMKIHLVKYMKSPIQIKPDSFFHAVTC